MKMDKNSTRPYKMCKADIFACLNIYVAKKKNPLGWDGML